VKDTPNKGINLKKDELYARLLQEKVITIDDILEAAEGIVSNPTRNHILKKYVRKFLKEGKLVRIRRGLYASLEPTQDPQSFTPDKFLVGAKIREDGFLGYHTALEFHGSANSAVYNTVYVCVDKSKGFEEFSFSGLRFKAVSPQDTEKGVVKEKYQGQSVVVTDKERTFIDCLDRVKYAGGWEECLKSLESLRSLDFDRLIDHLFLRENDFLRRKAGFVLNLLRETSGFYEHLTDEHLKKLSESTGKTPRYLEGAKETGEKPTFNKEWNLYVHQNFEERFLRGA